MMHKGFALSVARPVIRSAFGIVCMSLAALHLWLVWHHMVRPEGQHLAV